MVMAARNRVVPLSSFLAAGVMACSGAQSSCEPSPGPGAPAPAAPVAAAALPANAPAPAALPANPPGPLGPVPMPPASGAPGAPVAAGASGAPGAPAASGAPAAPSHTLTFLPGSTTKLEQILGELDRERQQMTRNKTWTRYGLRGTDLGYSFEHAGLVYFLFGDTVGRVGNALDSFATSSTTDPEGGVRLDFVMQGDTYAVIRPPGVSMGAFEVPVGGIDLGGQAYVIVRTRHSEDWSTDRTVLTRYTAPATFTPVRTFSDRFLTYALHLEPAGGVPGLPSGGPFVLVWATAKYRHSDLFLAIVPAAHFETGEGTRYYAGGGAGGAPVKWTSSEADAAPLWPDGQLGDVSVSWCAPLGLWLANYDHRPSAVTFRYSATPWGPWSDAQVLFTPAEARFIHDPARVPNDGLGHGGLTIGNHDPETTKGGAYAPYIVERWTKVRGQELVIYYTVSTWNPYTVVLMRSTFRVQ